MLEALPALLKLETYVSTVAVSHDGNCWLWGGGVPGEDCSISVCSAGTNETVLALTGHAKPVVRARFLPDGGIVSLSFDADLRRWSSKGELLFSCKASRRTGRTDGFALSSDGKLVAVGDSGGGISGWNLETGVEEFAFKASGRGPDIGALAFAPDGGRVLSGGADCKIRIWSTAKRRRESEIDLGMGNRIQAIACRPNGAEFAVAVAPDGAADDEAKNRIVLFDAASGQERLSLYPLRHTPLCCAYSPDGRFLAAAGGSDRRDAPQSKSNCVVHVWNAESGEGLARFQGHTALVRDLAFSPDSRWLLSAGWDQSVRCWRLLDPSSPAGAAEL